MNTELNILYNNIGKAENEVFKCRKVLLDAAEDLEVHVEITDSGRYKAFIKALDYDTTGYHPMEYTVYYTGCIVGARSKSTLDLAVIDILSYIPKERQPLVRIYFNKQRIHKTWVGV